LSLDAHLLVSAANSARSDINSSATGKNPRRRLMQTGLRTEGSWPRLADEERA
jgi:hypothetical protein